MPYAFASHAFKFIFKHSTRLRRREKKQRQKKELVDDAPLVEKRPEPQKKVGQKRVAPKKSTRAALDEGFSDEKGQNPK